MVQLGGSSLPAIGLLDLFPLFNMINSIANSYMKELKNIDTKKLKECRS